LADKGLPELTKEDGMLRANFVRGLLPVLLIALSLVPASAQVSPTEYQVDTAFAPGREQVVTYSTNPRAHTGGTTAEDILVIQTSDPWESSYHYVGNNWYDGITSDTMVLDALGYSYRIATWDDISNGLVDIFAYPVVLIVNDQVQAFYDDYAAHVAEFEDYVSAGHTLLFFAAGYGWAGGMLNAPLPGGVSWTVDLASYNVISDSTHPIVTAELSDHIPLVDADLYSNYCSHGWFSDLYSGTNVILRSSADMGSHPTLIEYHLGGGRVVASTLTWEHNWSYHTGGDGYGTFARKALDDVFLYAFSGGAVPVEADIDLHIDDAPSWWYVNKSRGSYVDVVARVSGDDDYEVNVVLAIPSDLFGLPNKTFTRNLPDNTGYGQENEYSNLGGGQYKITSTLHYQSGGRYVKELVWRFRLPDAISPQSDLTLDGTLSIAGRVIPNPTATAKMNIIDQARSLIVTNRKLLFSKYQPDPASNDVTPLLEEVYLHAGIYDGEVFYVDLYNDAARDWNQSVDYTSETTANPVAVAIDGLIDGWYNRLTRHPHPWETIRPEFLVIVGGDEIIPFYRADDRNYGDEEKQVYVDNNDPVGRVPHEHYMLSDNIYADVGGSRSEWEEGDLELSMGRIIGHSAQAMRQFIENASLTTPDLTHAVMASRSPDHNLDTVRSRLNSKHVTIYGESNPDLTENENWTRAQWLTALQQEYQVLAYQGHGAYDGWYGTDKWTSAVTASDQPVGQIATNKPLFVVEACNFAIPTDLNGTTWKPEVNDNISWKLISLGAAGIYASTAIDTTAGGDRIAYGERLHNDYFKYLIDTGSWGGLVPPSEFSEYWGTALLKAKQNYPGNGFPWGFNKTDHKALMEYVYYGLPWSFMATPDNAQAGAPATKGYQIDVTTIPEQADGTYSKTLTASVLSYQFVPVSGFELLEIPDADTLYAYRKPVLPFLYSTLSLPPGATVSGLSLLAEHSLSLGAHNIPAGDPITSFNAGQGYTSTMDVTGVYPPAPRYGYVADDMGDHVQLRIAIAPATYTVETQQVVLYDSTTLQLTFQANTPLVVGRVATDKPEYAVEDSITTLAAIENAGTSPLNLVARLNVYDGGGALVATTSSAPFTVPGGTEYSFELPWSPGLAPGDYRLTLSLEKEGVTQISVSTSFRILAGAITGFVVPPTLSFGQYSNFSLTFANYRSTPVTATARIMIYNSFGVEVTSLLQRTFTVEANAEGTTSWSWEPTGLPEGLYTARGNVEVGDETYASFARPTEVLQPTRVYLPVVIRGWGTGNYHWLDATDGTIVAQGDEAYTQVSLPFAFQFYGNTYTSLYVSSNGFISFGSGYTIYYNSCLPSTDTPNNAIYAFWDDLYPTGGSNGNVYVKQYDAGTFVIEWHAVKQYGAAYYETFEIVLRSDNAIALQYQSVENWGSSTVGIENGNGTVAQEYLCNGVGSPLSNNLVVLYAAP
jgi:hypothetical protein